MDLGAFEPHAGDLAPGDRGVAEQSWPSMSIHRIASAGDPLFDEAYEILWREFGERGEMERREVVADRLTWNPRERIDGYAMRYEMIAILEGARIVAVRDHSAIVPPAALAAPAPAAAPVGAEALAGAAAFTDAAAEVLVHLSHVLVEPDMRGRGLAGWLRAIPVATAREAWKLARGLEYASSYPPVTLVAEMEHDDGSGAVRRRLRSYARAGFRMADPSAVVYCQPDFRSKEDIRAHGARAVPLCLVLRRVGREDENSIPARELRRLVEALHAMFGAHVVADHMDELRRQLVLPGGDEQVALLVPGCAPASNKTDPPPAGIRGGTTPPDERSGPALPRAAKDLE